MTEGVDLLAGGSPFTAATIGLDERAIRALRRAGRIRSLLRSVYVDIRVADDLRTRAEALSLVLPPGAVLCRRTAAWLFGVDAFGRSERHQGLVLECMVPPDVPVVARPGVRCFEAQLKPSEITEVLGLPVTTAVRTGSDLLRYLPPHFALGAADALTHAGLTTVEALRASLEPLDGFRHIRQARRLVNLVEPATESFGESFLRLRMLDAGFPRPVVQIELRTRSGVVVWRLDLGWPDVKLAVEYDGAQDHTVAEDVAHDLQRRVSVTKQFGWTALSAGSAEVFGPSMALEDLVGGHLGLDRINGSRAW